jgi:transposase-like protein
MVVPPKNIVERYKLLVNQKVGIFKFLDAFSDEDECLQLYFSLKFSGNNCKKCGRPVVSNYYRKHGKKSFRCKSCHTEIYPLCDTIFKSSPISLTSIFCIIFFMSDQKNSISALEVTRRLGISYKTVHRTMILIRSILINAVDRKMKGIIEVDEAFIGKGSKIYNWSGISTHKQPIIGLIERETGNSRMFLVKDRKAATIRKLLLENVEIGSTVYTDSWRGYNCLSEYYSHQSVDHSKREYVRGKVHTNNIENLWGRMKRNIRGAHIKISDRYVQEYINEACWKNNQKNKSNMQLFNEILVCTFFASSKSSITQKKVKFIRGGKMSVVDPPRNLIAI